MTGQRRAGVSTKVELRSRVVGLVAVLALALSVLVAVPAAASLPDSVGSEHWLAFSPNEYPELTVLKVLISSGEATTGTLSIDGLGIEEDFTVVPGIVTEVVVPGDAMVSTPDGVADLGIHVVAEDDVSVYGFSGGFATTDAFLAYPVDALGTEHLVLGYPGSWVPGTFATVVATQDGTTLTITPSVSTATRAAGVPYSVTLDRGEVYQLETPQDLSGTVVVSDHPVAVLSGSRCANVPVDTLYCDHLVEQMPPTSAWGTKFATVPLAGRTEGDRFRVMAAGDATKVSVDGVVVADLDRGEHHEMVLTAPSGITADAPVLVAQYSHSIRYDRSELGDPFMILVTPLEQYLASYTVASPTLFGDVNVHWLNLVAEPGEVGAIALDGVPVPAGRFSPIGSTGLFGASVQVLPGTHSLRGPRPFGVSAYGFGQNDSYGYAGGMAMAPVARIASVTAGLVPEGESQPVGTEVCAVATILDQYEVALEGVRVEFSVDGVSPGNGFVTTGADGTAEHCWTGAAVGTDTVTATAGDLADTVSVTWQPVVAGLNVALSPPDAAPPVGGEVCAVATVTDQDDEPYVGATVSFAVSGANPGAGTATSGSDGTAEHCWTGVSFGTDTVTASVGEHSDTATLDWQQLPCATPFVDVGEAHPFCRDIEWMAGKGLATGWPDGTFRPGLSVSRQAKAAFLWRLAGSPEPEPGPPSFSDVPAGHPFADAIAWMAQEGIAEGYEDGTYRPTEPISRQAMAAFIWRLAGSPTPDAGYPTFPDVPADSAFREAIGWMAAVGIAEGYEDGTYRPTDPTSRQAMAAFMHRASKVVQAD